MIPLLARCGRIAEANHAVAVAERIIAQMRGARRRESEGELLLAKLRLSRYADGGESVFQILALLREHFSIKAFEGDERAAARLAAAFIESAQVDVSVANYQAGITAIEASESFAARCSTFPMALRLQSAALSACLRWLRPDLMAAAHRDLATVYGLAQRHGLSRIALGALDGLAQIAFTERRTETALRYAGAIVNQARQNNHDEYVLRNEILVALGQNRLAGGYAGLFRLKMVCAPHPGPAGDSLDFVRAHILARAGINEAALTILNRLVRCCRDQKLTALALWERSCVAAAVHRPVAAQRDIEEALPLLERSVFPIRLAVAFRHAYELTGKRTYRDDATDLWRLIGPAIAAGREVDDCIVVDDAAVADLGASPNQSTSSLTPRQEQVAWLVRSGKTNRQIASELGVSVRTIDHHVGAILQQQHVGRRWQVRVSGVSPAAS